MTWGNFLHVIFYFTLSNRALSFVSDVSDFFMFGVVVGSRRGLLMDGDKKTLMLISGFLSREGGFEPPEPHGSTVFPEGIPMGQDRRDRPLCHEIINVFSK